MIRYEPLKQVQLGESGKAGETGKPAVRPAIPAKMTGSAPSAADVTKQRILTEGTGLTQLDLAVQIQKPKNFSGFRTGGSGTTRTGGTFSKTYGLEKDRLRKEAEDEFAHNMTDWGQTIIRNSAVNPDFPQGAGLVNYIQLLLQSPKGIEYERYTSAEQEAEKRKQIEKITDWANQNGRSPFLSKLYGEEKNGILNAPTGLSLLTAPLRGVDYVLDALETAYTGAPLPDSNPDFTETTQALREGVSQDMGKAGQFVYNAALSTADSLIAGWMGGGSVGGGIILGLGTASDTAHDIINRGGTGEDALIGGAVSGILEGVFEKLSLGQLEGLKALPADSVRSILGNVAKSVVANAGEELSTELANTIFDTVFMGELSTYQLTVEGYLSQGKSEADARRLANLDLLERLGKSAAAGALTGALFGSGASANSYYRAVTAAQGEANLRAGEMPTRGQLQAMNLSESEARGAMVLLGLEQIDDEAAETVAAGAIDTSLIGSRDVLTSIDKRNTIKIKGGFACFPDGDPLIQNCKQVFPKENTFDVAMHGTPTAVCFGGKVANMSPRMLASVIRHSEGYHGQNIRLLSCSTGYRENGEICFAEELANALGVTVEAPNDTLYIFSNGALQIGLYGEGKMVLYKPNERRRTK